jgi:hypothetical protein
MISRVIRVFVPFVFIATLSAQSQRFYPDDPISKDPDSLSIKKPASISLSLTYDAVENSLGLEKTGSLVRSQNTNTLGEVPNSSWFSNRIGVREMTREELVRGGSRTGGPDTSSPLTVVGAGLLSATEGIVIRDKHGDEYYLTFDPAGMARMATGAAVVADKFFYAAGYNVFPASISAFDPAKATISPEAKIDLLGNKYAPLDKEFLKLFLQDKQRSPDGAYRVVAYYLPPGESVGEFKFYGTRSDDPNDVFPHENRRELRAMGVFASWLNHYQYRSINTLDRYETFEGRSYVRHYLKDFSTTLGSGHDLDGKIVPKAKWSGNEYAVGDLNAILKTAGTLGFWKRPWMNIEYPHYPEIGTFEADYFEPEKWRPAYPNAAYARMLPDDAFWAARIVARFSDEDIRAIVHTGEYSEPAAEKYLADALIKRRDKIVAAYFKQINPLDGFVVTDGHLRFRNLGVEARLATDAYYEYVVNTYDHERNTHSPITDRTLTDTADIPLPRDGGEYLMVRIRTRSAQQRGWRKNVDVFLRTKGDAGVIGIDREVGAYVLDHDLRGQPVARSSIEFGGSYEGLSDDQKGLVEDWIRRYDQVTGRNTTPESAYNNLPMSARTTFEAVTNALAETGLTDKSGKDLGVALDLVSRVESVHGRIEGEGGDQQFRIYVELIPEALGILESSQQYERARDNTVFHKGYPRTYRQIGGLPSIQFSTTEDGTRADIDVDYRSSSFPGALLNGHLTAANSDVRAGSNYSLHSNRWEGFDNWWRGLFGLSFLGEVQGSTEFQVAIPSVPRKATGSLDDAMADWLKAFLIERKPEQAAAYLARSSYACMDVWSEENPVDYGIAPAILLESLRAVNQAIGRVDNLKDVVQPETVPRLKVIEQKNNDLFTLYEVPPDLGVQFDCARKYNLKTPQTVTATAADGGFFGSAFRLKTPKGKGKGRVLFLWAKEDKKWRILSFVVDPGLRESGEIPDTRPEQRLALQTMQADPAFLTTAGEFFTQWRTGNIDDALTHFASQSMPCVALNMKETLGPGVEAARSRLRMGLERVHQAFSAAKDASDFIQPVEFTHPDIRVVEHSRSNRYTLAGLPDHLGTAFACDVPIREVTFQKPNESVYGNHYASALKLSLIGDDSAALYMVWAKVGTEWKIVSFYLVAA